MKYDKKIETEVILQYLIKEQKEKLMNNITLYRMFLFAQNVKYTKENVNEIYKLYGTVIGLLFKNFYGFNSGEMKTILKQVNIKVPGNNIIYIMDENHLKYNLSMLQSMNNYMDNNPETSIEEIIKVATSISTTAQEDFCNTNKEGELPYNNLVFINKYEPTNDKKPRKKENKNTALQMTLEEIIRKR